MIDKLIEITSKILTKKSIKCDLDRVFASSSIIHLLYNLRGVFYIECEISCNSSYLGYGVIIFNHMYFFSLRYLVVITLFCVKFTSYMNPIQYLYQFMHFGLLG